MDPGEEAATPTHNQNNNSHQGTATPTSNYNLLLHQIQTLSDLQSGGGIQNADPSLQVSKKYKLQFSFVFLNVRILLCFFADVFVSGCLRFALAAAGRTD